LIINKKLTEIKLVKTVAYYIPVKEEYLGKWEYYDADFEMLKNAGFRVLVCSSFYSALCAINKSDFLFAWWWGRSLPVILIYKFFRKKVVTTGAIHMFDLSGAGCFHDKGILYRIFNKWGLIFSDVNLYISEHQKLSIESFIKRARGAVLYPSLSSKFTVEKIDIISRGRNILVLAWLTKASCIRKGVFDAVRAFAHIVKTDKTLISDSKLIIAGKAGDALPLLELLIRELGIADRVIFELDISQKRKVELYTSSCCLFAPSYMEGFGNANLEAMVCGLPVICTSEGASKESVNGAGIVVVGVGVEAAAKGLKSLLMLSRTDFNKMSEDARDRVVTEFSESARIRRLMKIFLLSNVI
jgi:glycosyltransferase involved in cell wall biosynthesis